MDTIIKAKKGNKKAIKQIVKENIIQVYRLIFLHTKYEEDAKNILENISQKVCRFTKSPYLCIRNQEMIAPMIR